MCEASSGQPVAYYEMKKKEEAINDWQCENESNDIL